MIQITGIPRLNPYRHRRSSPDADFTTCPLCRQTYQPGVRLACCPHPIISPMRLFPVDTRIAIRKFKSKDKRPPLVLEEPYYFQQIAETDVRFNAFKMWLDLGEKRTIIAVARRLHKSYTIVRRWADEDKWTVRLQAFNRDQDIERRAARKKLLQKDEADMFRLARGLGRITAKGLAQLVKDAEAGKVEEIGYDKLRAGAETTVKLLRLLHEQSTENIAHDTPDLKKERKFKGALLDAQETLQDLLAAHPEATDEDIERFRDQAIDWAADFSQVDRGELSAAIGGKVDETSTAEN